MLTHSSIYKSGWRPVRDLSLAILILFSNTVWAQGEIGIGDKDFFETPFGTKTIDIGFRNWACLNTSTVKHTNHLLLRWKSPDSTAKWEIRIGVPKCRLADADFGLIELWSLETPDTCFNWLILPVEIGSAEKYLLRVAGFDYVMRVVSEDRYYRSQIRYVKQRW